MSLLCLLTAINVKAYDWLCYVSNFIEEEGNALTSVLAVCIIKV